uniref:Bm10201 n=1 Tax=Brugia malayi TaxID=6279 RepID=A0A0J9XWC2_BRUMA|nr:Bm10201 [Brugia malayi]
MDLPREEDYNAYDQLGCRFIEAKIRVNIPIHCKDEIYKREDTLMGRLIYMCTCPGKPLSDRMNQSTCDVKLEKEIATKAIRDAEKSKLPKCYYMDFMTKTVNSAPTGITEFLMNNITKPSNGNTPCNKKKEIQSMFMRDLVPIDSVWTKTEETFRQEQNFCIQPDRNLAKCKSPMGCYHIRYAMISDPRAISNNLSAGCISDIDQTLLEKYPYLALCSNYLKNGFAKKCFYTDTRDAMTSIPLVVCCCNTNPYNDCPLRAHVNDLGFAYKMIKEENKFEISSEQKKKLKNKVKNKLNLLQSLGKNQ